MYNKVYYELVFLPLYTTFVSFFCLVGWLYCTQSEQYHCCCLIHILSSAGNTAIYLFVYLYGEKSGTLPGQHYFHALYIYLVGLFRWRKWVTNPELVELPESNNYLCVNDCDKCLLKILDGLVIIYINLVWQVFKKMLTNIKFKKWQLSSLTSNSCQVWRETAVKFKNDRFQVLLLTVIQYDHPSVTWVT